MNSRLLLALALCCLPGLVACGGDGDGSTVDSGGTLQARSPDGQDVSQTPNPTGEPVLEAPASKYTVLLQDVGPRWYTDIPGVFTIDKDAYSSGKLFADNDDGMKLLNDWGYQEGYETSLLPEGRTTAILNGLFEFKVETHLFESADGAKKAYQYFHGAVNRNSEAATIAEVGNESSGWSHVYGEIPNTKTEGVFHQVLFRRGNLVVIVQTFGSAAFMTVDDAYELARIADDKATGGREAVAPTPTSNFTPEVAGSPAIRRTPVSALTQQTGSTPAP